MKVRILQGSAFACLLVVAACAPPPAPTSGTAADEAALRGMATKYADAFNSGDVPSLVAMVTDDYQAVSADGTAVTNKAAFEDMEKKSAAQRTGLGMKLSIETKYVKWAGANAATLGGTWAMAGVPAGMGADKGAWTAMAEKGADGQWKLATGLVAEYVPPPTMAMPPPPPTPKGKGK